MPRNPANSSFNNLGGGGGGGGSTEWGDITGTLSSQTDLNSALAAKAPLASPTFTGTVDGITKAMVGLGNVDNTADTAKPISTATQTALDSKQNTLVSGTNIRTVNGSSLLGSGDISVGAVIYQATVTVPRTGGGRYQHIENVADASIASSDQIIVSLAGGTVSDENQAEMLDLRAIGAEAYDGGFTVSLSFLTAQAGPIKINYMRG